MILIEKNPSLTSTKDSVKIKYISAGARYKVGLVEKALLVFSKLEKKCASAWTALIGGFAINGKGREALDWFTKCRKQELSQTRSLSLQF